MIMETRCGWLAGLTSIRRLGLSTCCAVSPTIQLRGFPNC
jgi:hypothetical protein